MFFFKFILTCSTGIEATPIFLRGNRTLPINFLLWHKSGLLNLHVTYDVSSTWVRVTQHEFLSCFPSSLLLLPFWPTVSVRWEELGGWGGRAVVTQCQSGGREQTRGHTAVIQPHTSLYSGLFRFLWSFWFLFFCFRATFWGTRIPCAWTGRKGMLIFPPPDLEEFCRNRVCVCVCVSTAITQIIIPPLPLTVSRSRSRCRCCSCSSAHLPLEDYNTVNGAVYRCRVCLKCV